MASSKDTFESHTFRANTFACGTFRGTGADIILPPARKTTAAARPLGEFRNRGVSTTAAGRTEGEFPTR